MNRPGVTISQVTKRVATYPRGRGRVVQHHRGYRAYVWLPGVREPEPCCDFHQKRRAALEHGLRVARILARQHGLDAPIDPRDRKRPL